MSEVSQALIKMSDKHVKSTEISNDVKKLHYHFYLQINSVNKVDSVLTAIRRKLKEYEYTRSSFCVQLVDDLDKYICYIIKDGNYSHNLENMEEYILKSALINSEKKLKMKDKILNFVKLNLPLEPTPSKEMISDTMMRYFEERKLLKPAPRSNLYTQYIIYLLDNYNYNTDIFYHQALALNL
jgi:hypothetical protein